MPPNIRPVVFENIVWLSGLGLFQRDVEEIIGVLQSAIYKSPMLYSREQQSYTGATWASIEDNNFKRRPYSFPYHEAKYFPLTVQDQDGADQANWTPCICRNIQGHLVAAGI